MGEVDRVAGRRRARGAVAFAICLDVVERGLVDVEGGCPKGMDGQVVWGRAGRAQTYGHPTRPVGVIALRIRSDVDFAVAEGKWHDADHGRVFEVGSAIGADGLENLEALFGSMG